MIHRVLIVGITLGALSCANGVVDTNMTGQNSTAPKSDQAQLTDIDWANEFFLTQIYDAHWNASAIEADRTSNNCGPASLAMLMRESSVSPEALTAQMAIDHARALMYPDYPEVDPSDLPDGATLYVDAGTVFVQDNTRPVYFDLMEELPSIPQGIVNGGGAPVFGYSWDDLEMFLETHGSVIAYGHITEDWNARFSGDYGTFDSGAVPHFIALFPASLTGDYIVCDPMHRGGAVVMTRNELQTFFKSPVNVYETTIRLVAWQRAPETGN